MDFMEVTLSKLRCISVPGDNFILANIADPAAFHPVFCCLQKYSFHG